MTQMLLFDTPATDSFAPGTPFVEEAAVAKQATESVRSSPNQNQHRRGLNHMGDLARLVLLRYDLVAQRRAKRLAKQAAGNA